MIAGAPGAFGSLVIFNSSGETGWKLIGQSGVVCEAIRKRKLRRKRILES
jgi:hypothetical protein